MFSIIKKLRANDYIVKTEGKRLHRTCAFVVYRNICENYYFCNVDSTSKKRHNKTSTGIKRNRHLMSTYKNENA